MAEGIAGLTPTRQPPLPAVTVQRVIDLALGPRREKRALDRPAVGEGGRRELAIGAAHP